MVASVPDLLRLLVIPVFAWAAWRDIHTRRLPNKLWPPLVVLGALLLVWEAAQFFVFGQSGGRLFLIQAGISVLFVGPLGYAFWWFGAFGAADAKAMIVLSILLPTFPSYTLGGLELPLVDTALGVFSLTILTNAVLLAVVVPVALGVRNAAGGRVEPLAMFLARPVRIDSLPDRHGRLFETLDGITTDGLDLDVLRMYLRWRGLPLAALRADPDAARDPASIDDTGDPTDGRSDVADDLSWDDASATPNSGNVTPTDDVADPWGAEEFFDSVEGSTYGTDPEQLRAGLELLARTDSETIWVSPGLPFVVPMFAGLVVAFIYGDLLFGFLGLLGFGFI
ncbi:A24 family peptidase [Halonotius terrestris]|uniref:A24 family peptidase n=1 Tax=Halonotius terrestris TaxID=2487750 RepID=A0A8J8PA32_9EURY|nr:A24 family peptidase C-terminal domain-containing protein [Halonotius terrestris]TQQ83818.1 A24 family peptidase [Halonotius terrestris]